MTESFNNFENLIDWENNSQIALSYKNNSDNYQIRQKYFEEEIKAEEYYGIDYEKRHNNSIIHLLNVYREYGNIDLDITYSINLEIQSAKEKGIFINQKIINNQIKIIEKNF